MTAPDTDTPKPVWADGGSRAAAFLIDSMALIFAIAALESHFGRPLPPGTNWLLALLYFGVFPMTALEGTPGKWMARIRLCDRAGNRLRPGRALLRAAAMLAWLWLIAQVRRMRPEDGSAEYLVMAGWMLFFLAWGTIYLTPRGQTVFDLLAGTLVVRRNVRPEAIAAAPPREQRIAEAGAGVAMCLMLGAFIHVASSEARVRNLRARVGYAIEATAPLRGKVADFHAREGRWPTANDLDVAEFTPYTDGGGYRLRRDGVVEIGFSVLPELKGKTVTLRPMSGAGPGGIEWKCSADPALHRSYLQADCR